MTTEQKAQQKKGSADENETKVHELGVRHDRQIQQVTRKNERVEELTHSEICGCTSPLSNRHQCRSAISKRDLDISLGIGATAVLRNAASQPVDEVLFTSGCREKKRERGTEGEREREK